MGDPVFTTHILNSLEETEKVAFRLAEEIHQGDVIAFYGDLGAGKTTFISYLCAKLYVSEDVTSPTFTIINEYTGNPDLPVYHFDFYRLKNTNELKALNFDDYIYGEGLCLIEWADKIEAFLPPETIKINMWFNEKGERLIKIKAANERG